MRGRAQRLLALFLLELERDGIDAVPQARGRGAVVEHVTEVAVAAAAEHLFADHTVARVGFSSHVFGLHRSDETGPARPGVELLEGAKQGIAAAGAGCGV